MFQQGSRPYGNTAETKPYYSAKHKLLGYKTEASVLSNSIFILLPRHEKCDVADTTIFCKRLSKHRYLTRKDANESELFDVLGVVHTNWAVLANKGYQGLQSNISE